VVTLAPVGTGDAEDVASSVVVVLGVGQSTGLAADTCQGVGAGAGAGCAIGVFA
jgi:hypothetical protein